LFEPRLWLGSAIEFPFYPREHRRDRKPPLARGLGRYAGGKWEFPVKPGGVADPVPDSLGVLGRHSPHELAAVADRIFVATASGVYMGPGTWKRILSGPVLLLRESTDRKALLITREEPKSPATQESDPTYQRCRYELSTGKITTERLADKGDWWMREKYWAISSADAQWSASWVRLPGLGGGDWAVGDLGNPDHSLTETPKAFWIGSAGELIRIDRKQLDKSLESPGARPR
jgi:hypothetical protein